jgi:hypothetical protein
MDDTEQRRRHAGPQVLRTHGPRCDNIYGGDQRFRFVAWAVTSTSLLLWGASRPEAEDANGAA